MMQSKNQTYREHLKKLIEAHVGKIVVLLVGIAVLAFWLITRPVLWLIVISYMLAKYFMMQ